MVGVQGRRWGEGRLSVHPEAGGVSEQVLCSGASLHPSLGLLPSPVLDSGTQQDGPPPHTGGPWPGRRWSLTLVRPGALRTLVQTILSSWVGGVFEEEVDLDRAGEAVGW